MLAPGDDQPDPDVEAMAAWDPSVLDGLDLDADRERRTRLEADGRRRSRLERWPVVDEDWARRVAGRGAHPGRGHPTD